MADKRIEDLIRNQPPELSVLTELLADDEINGELFARADAVKRSVFGNRVFVRGIIEFSNNCRCKCAYCGISSLMKRVARYRMQPDELVECAVLAAQVYRTVILQSGEDGFYTAEMLADIVSRIKKRTGVAVTLSVGERSRREYEILRAAGADRFLIKHETADPVLYEQFHQARLSDRLVCQEHLAALAYELGSGFMVGLPGQTDAVLAADLLLLKKMNVAMAGIGPFIAHPDTPLGKYPDGDPVKTLKVLALARILLPECHLPSTTALNVKGGMVNALHAGADVIMQKATPFVYRRLYDIYPGRDAKDMPLLEQRRELDEKLAQMGLQSV